MTTVITGSASGIGAAVRSRLEKMGERIVGIDLRNAEIEANLSTKEGREAAIASVKQICGDQLDGFVAVAGVSPPAESSLITSVNYFGAIDLLDGLFELLQKGTNPAAVVISSNAANMLVYAEDDPYIKALMEHDEERAKKIIEEMNEIDSGYARSKHAVGRAVRHRAATWGQAGVRLNAVAPGLTMTPMLERVLDDPVIGAGAKALPIPLGRYAESEELASIIVLLLGEEASYVHGAVFYVDGGVDATIRPNRF